MSEKPIRMLVIGAHPADPFDLAGGTIAIHAERGDDVHLCTVTTGIWSHTHDDSICVNVDWEREAVYRKKQEFRSAAHLLGVTRYGQTHFIGLQDEPLMVNEEGVLGLMELIRALKPDILITHHPTEVAHLDHAETGKAVLRALKASQKRPGKKHFVPAVYFFSLPAIRPEVARLGHVIQAPDILIGLKPQYVSLKISAMCELVSQGLNDVDKMQERMNSYESEMGRADGFRYSEGFNLYQPLKRDFLPLNKDVQFYA